MAFDDCHDQVVNALEKAGWQITEESYYIRYQGFEVFPDIKARQTNGKTDEIIVVEVKCFADERHYRDDVYRSVGQYLIYRNILRLKRSNAKIYLALPSFAYDLLFINLVVEETLKESNISLLVVDIEAEEIVRWIG